MTFLSLSRTVGIATLVALSLAGCARTVTPAQQDPQITTNTGDVAYGNYGPRQPSSGFTGPRSVISDSATTGTFGTTDQISVDGSGPFPNNDPSLDPSLSDLSADDQALLAGIDIEGDAALAANISFSGDDGTPNFFDADVGSTVYFATNSSELSEEAREVLRKQAAWLNVHENVTATIEGHTDERGTREFNIALGERRASAVRGYLTALGVGTDRVRKISFGKERPAVPGSSQSAWDANRRAVTVLDPSTGPVPASGITVAPSSSPSDESSIDELLNDPVLNDLPTNDPLLDDPFLNDPLLNDPLLNDV